MQLERLSEHERMSKQTHGMSKQDVVAGMYWRTRMYVPMKQ